MWFCITVMLCGLNRSFHLDVEEKSITRKRRVWFGSTKLIKPTDSCAEAIAKASLPLQEQFP